MAEPVNLDLWQIAAEQGPVNLDLGATDAETVYSSTISATIKPTTADINGRIILDASVNVSTRQSVTDVAATLIYEWSLSGSASNTQIAVNPKYILNASADARSSHSLQFNNSSSYDINVYRDPAGYGGNVWDKQAVSANHETGACDWQSAQRMPSDKPVEWDKPSDINAEPGAVPVTCWCMIYN